MPVPVIRLQAVSHTRCVSPSQRALPEQRLIIISGEEGAGKSTIVRALLPSTPYGARIDAEDIGQTNPCSMDDTFFDLLRRNVAGLVENFWAAGYVNVIAGSFLRRYSDYVSFRQLLRPSAVFLVDLLVDKEVRDHRRITRAKRTTQEWRDMVDHIPEDRTIRRAADADYASTRPAWTSAEPCSGSKAPSRRSMQARQGACPLRACNGRRTGATHGYRPSRR